MKYPEFYNNIEHIVLKDELSAILGASEEGIIDISYLEIVKMAGHSCPTVAGSYLMALKGLKALFIGDLPKRGEIKVELKGTLEDNESVVGMVLSNITGATDNTGFLGIQGKYNRRGLMFYGANIEANIRLTRVDTGKSVEVSYSPSKIKNPKVITQSAFAPNATSENKKVFAKEWQAIVEDIFNNQDVVIDIVEL